MLSEQRRADVLAQVGPVLAVVIEEQAGERWIYIPQAAPDFAILSRCSDGMQIGMTPGWFEGGTRFGFSPCIRFKGAAHTLASLRLVRHSRPPPCIHVTMGRGGVDAVAADLLQHLVQPYEPVFREALSRIGLMQSGASAQQQVADVIAGLTGAVQERRGEDIALSPDVCGVSLPLRVSPAGSIELGQTSVTTEQVSAIVAGLRRADLLRPGRRAGR